MKLFYFNQDLKEEILRMRSEKTRNMSITAMLIAVMLIMYRLPYLGYIRLGFVDATLMHIPVIIGGILLGPKSGALLGGVFGLTSLLKSTYEPTVISFVFSPFYSLGEVHGNFFSLIVCFLPRILIGVTAYYMYKLLKKEIKKENVSRGLAFIGAGIAGSMTNTILVMNFIYLFFGKAYAQATGKAFEVLYGAIMTIILVNGIPEAVIAAIIVTAVGIPLVKLKGA
jgi:uncharacterized membrane protein